MLQILPIIIVIMMIIMIAIIMILSASLCRCWSAPLLTFAHSLAIRSDKQDLSQSTNHPPLFLCPLLCSLYLLGRAIAGVFLSHSAVPTKQIAAALSLFFSSWWRSCTAFPLSSSFSVTFALLCLEATLSLSILHKVFNLLLTLTHSLSLSLCL